MDEVTWGLYDENNVYKRAGDVLIAVEHLLFCFYRFCFTNVVTVIRFSLRLDSLNASGRPGRLKRDPSWPPIALLWHA